MSDQKEMVMFVLDLNTIQTVKDLYDQWKLGHYKIQYDALMKWDCSKTPSVLSMYLRSNLSFVAGFQCI